MNREYISELLADDWKVVSFTSHHHEMLESDNVERISHKLLLQKDDSLRLYEVHFGGNTYDSVIEIIIAPGMHA
jgi:hypothetical protein